MRNIIEKVINQQHIYIAEKHHHILLPWAKIKRENQKEDILLISLDHHTDIHEPFLRYCNNNKQEMCNMVTHINYNIDDSISNAIAKLENDEHIKAAIRSGILYKAFIISHSATSESPQSIEETERIKKLQNCDEEYLLNIVSGNYGITPREKRHYEESEIYMPAFWSEDMSEYGGEFDDMVLEDGFLLDKMYTLGKMSPELFDKNGSIRYKYILDIDLDYFHTMKSIQPSSIGVFSRLAKEAVAITVAKETVCVELERTENSVTSAVLLKEILGLFEMIL